MVSAARSKLQGLLARLKRGKANVGALLPAPGRGQLAGFQRGNRLRCGDLLDKHRQEKPAAAARVMHFYLKP